MICSRGGVRARSSTSSPSTPSPTRSAAINDSRFGLQCGVFTPRSTTRFGAHDELEVGGIIVNDAPTWRTDAMPYGGVKDSGLGREGLRWSIEDMTEPRLLAFAPTPS